MKFTLLIPTLNEIEGVKAIIPQVKKSWVDEILVIDGHSKDGTPEWFKEHGFNVITQRRPGTNGAWWDGFDASTGDVIILFSPDNNSLPEKIPLLVEKMKEGYDMVIASRYKDGAKSEDDDFLSAIANYAFNKLINFLFRARYTDTLVMYRAFRKNLLRELGFTYETGLELNRYRVGLFEILSSIRAAKVNMKVAEIPADEPDRLGKGARAHPTKTIKIYNGFLMLYHTFREFFSGSNPPVLQAQSEKTKQEGRP